MTAHDKPKTNKNNINMMGEHPFLWKNAYCHPNGVTVTRKSRAVKLSLASGPTNKPEPIQAVPTTLAFSMLPYSDSYSLTTQTTLSSKQVQNEKQWHDDEKQAYLDWTIMWLTLCSSLKTHLHLCPWSVLPAKPKPINTRQRKWGITTITHVRFASIRAPSRKMVKKIHPYRAQCWYKVAALCGKMDWS